MHVRSLLALFILATLVGGAAQRPSLDVTHDRLPTIEEDLQRLRIPLTRPALVQALRNADPAVRALAAMKLAQDKATETVPAIQEALAAEKVTRTRVKMAFSLAHLGEDRGFGVLNEACRDAAAETWLRLQAASYLFDYLLREDKTCRSSLIGILQSQPTSESLVGVVSLLRGLRGLSPEESQTILQVSRKALAAPDPPLRMAASRTLGDLGDRSAAPYLQSAIAKEKNKTVRSQMKNDLGRLRKQQKQ